MNELEFTSVVSNWVNEVIDHSQDLPFSEARCEQQRKGSTKRRDLTLLDKDRLVCLTGEVKLPYQKDGSSPYNASVVDDARQKAQRAGAPFFFTWNVNEFVLWETSSAKKPLREQNYRSWKVTNVHSESQLEHPSTTQVIRNWLAQFLTEYGEIRYGALKIGYKPPDEKFIEMLESSLQMPILLNIAELVVHYGNGRFKSELDKWMRDEQGWVIYSDPDGIRDNLERAAKFSCYTLVNKLVFYEALLKRHGGKLNKITVPDHIDTGDGLRLHLEGYFTDAKKATKDYETVFGEDHKLIGSRIPFSSDKTAPHWRALINQIHDFDFSKLDYEIIGRIFERLISPEERHKFGQFYTRAEVVDLINSFCIRNGDEKIMDAACGGGTFLVRAYARKRELDPSRKHHQLLSDLYGVDVSHFAAHLTTINLATRDLIDDDNYPQIARSDFFDISVHKSFLKLPKNVGPGKGQHRDVEIAPLDAVVGNPPYVRQEDIPRSDKKGNNGLKRGTKEYLLRLVREESRANLSGRSDLHCYFWPHASTFLKEDGYLCLLTSSQWLDVEYGFRLQEWILNNFQIIAVFESVDEPWFVGARVATAVTVLRRQMNREARMSNLVRFVQLRQPISDTMPHDGSTADAITAADTFRDEILSLTRNTTNDRYRIRLIPQADLLETGIKLGRIMKGTKADVEGDEDAEPAPESDYYGGKWGCLSESSRSVV